MIKRFFAAAMLMAALLNLSSCAEKPRKDYSEIVTESTTVSAPPEETSPEPKTPVYDFTEIIKAHESGDASRLNEKDSVIYSSALDVANSIFNDEMSGEEKVVAAHDWLVYNITYDSAGLLPIPTVTPDAENPYGVFTRGMGTCMGYTTTFQLLMILGGVESQVVQGVAGEDSEEHAWNMVRLDGNWYHVDTTWDDFVPDYEGRMPFHIYTLVTDSFMEAEHVWDKSKTPEADDDSKMYYKTHGLFAETCEENTAILEKAHEASQTMAEIMTKDLSTITYEHVAEYWPNEFGDCVITIYWLI